jgi:hypothetical protein
METKFMLANGTRVEIGDAVIVSPKLNDPFIHEFSAVVSEIQKYTATVVDGDGISWHVDHDQIELDYDPFFDGMVLC